MHLFVLDCTLLSILSGADVLTRHHCVHTLLHLLHVTLLLPGDCARGAAILLASFYLLSLTDHLSEWLTMSSMEMVTGGGGDSLAVWLLHQVTVRLLHMAADGGAFWGKETGGMDWTGIWQELTGGLAGGERGGQKEEDLEGDTGDLLDCFYIMLSCLFVCSFFKYII